MTGSVRVAGEQLHGEFEPTDETCTERDEPDAVAENPHVTAMVPRADDSGMVSEIGARLENRRSPARAARHQHRVVRTDRPIGTREPTQDVGLRRSAEAVRAPGAQIRGVAVGEYIRVTGELEHRLPTVDVDRKHLDGTVDRREQALRRGDECFVQRMHRRQITVGRMRVDVMSFPGPLREMGDFAHRAKAAGFDGILLTEGGRTAYTAATAMAIAEPEMHYSTGVAVAFPRSPMVTAQCAWELQEATGGRFRLGLGTQVKAHIVRRYGAEFAQPGPRMRDYILAVKDCFAGFRGEPLDHRGDFYELTLLNRQWSPGPIDVPDPKVDVAAVNPWMLKMAGEVADGVHLHPITDPGYVERHAVPAIAQGARKAGRDPADIALIKPVMTIVGDTDEEIAAGREVARLSVAFYASTPNYAFVLDEAGFEGTTSRIRAKQKAGDFAGMTAEVTDEHLAAFCVEASWDGLADALIDRFGGTAGRLVFYNAATDTPERFARYGAVAREITARTETAPPRTDRPETDRPQTDQHGVTG